ncbi:MAG: T9SS type A sorting domain-containing protein [Ignavibacteriae bacterium]|nr:T9SS type A sorting domain-containing protein [Ignavibacteriota bacterium]
MAAMIAVLLCFGTVALAQTPAFYNTAANSTTNAYPFNTTSSMKVEQHYLAGEFAGAYAGNITKVYWMGDAAVSPTYTNLKIWLGQTTGTFGTSTTTYATTGMTQVYNAASTPVTVPGANSWFGITLQTPFPYNPTQSLIVIFCHEGYSGTGIGLRYPGTSTVPPYRRIYGPACSSTAGSGTDGAGYNFGFDLASPNFNDAGIFGLVSPVNFCAGSYDIQVKLMNFGKQNLTSTTIKWTYDGVPESDYSWSGNLAPLSETTVTLGTKNFAAGVNHPLKVWTQLPNNVPDTGVFNDTLKANLKPALSGTFTIGGATPNYATFSAAAADLVANGVCGPVVFNVRPGTYTERVNLGIIPGTSNTNTVTFKSENGNRTSVIVQYAPTGTGDLGTVNMGGADWVTFRDMTIQSTGTTYAAAVQFAGGSDNNRFINNVLKGYASATTSTYQAVIYSPSPSLDNNNSFIGNSIEGGAYAAYWYGTGTGETNTLFDGNMMTGQYYMGLSMYYQNTPIIRNNTLNMTSTYSTNYLYYLYYFYGPYQVTGNKLIGLTTTGTKYGMYLYTNGATNTAASAPLVANNFIALDGGASVSYGIWLYYGSFTNVFHNTVYINSSSTTSRGLTIYYGTDNKSWNNIFYNPLGAMSYYFLDNVAQTTMDYNIHYTTGTNLAYLGGSYATNIGAMQTLLGSGREMNSKVKIVNFASPTTGDLHLAGASQNDMGLVATLLPQVTNDIDNDPRVLPYAGADEACYILGNKVSYELRDANGAKLSYINAPGTVYVYYSIDFPATAFTFTGTLKLYDVTTNALVFQSQFQGSKLAGQAATGTAQITIPSTVAPNTYRAEVIYNMPNSCGYFVDFTAGAGVLLVIPQGMVPCVVWPGDVNNDGIVNYGDRSALNRYISNANLRATWLQGPARYRVDFATNPFTYYTWEGQVAVPWQTPDGCYMDTDGSGAINNFDYLAMKLNWMKTHGTPKGGTNGFSPENFDMDQNYPNPFNPTTTIRFAAPERATVRLVVTDLLGREITKLVNGSVDAGVHTATFDAATLESGQYIATITMTGIESGINFSKSIKLSLVK